MAVLVTGAAGFIGFHLSRRLLADGVQVIGCDSLNSYYDPSLKRDRLHQLRLETGFTFHELDLSDQAAVTRLFAAGGFTQVVHLAAQAGVRYSLENPHAYIRSNISGFVNMLEACRSHRIEHFVYASSSSVYGLNQNMPFSEHRGADHPVSLYAATKRSNELLAHSYSHLFALPTTALRFFTVYGPWGRPDMAYWSFAERILAGKPITLFNHGRMHRDYTFVDDVVEAVARIIPCPPSASSAFTGASPDPAISSARYRIYNIGNGQPVELGRFVEVLEQALGTKADIQFSSMQQGDVEATAADISDLTRDFGFRPKTTVEEGLQQFCSWFTAYRGSKQQP